VLTKATWAYRPIHWCCTAVDSNCPKKTTQVLSAPSELSLVVACCLLVWYYTLKWNSLLISFEDWGWRLWANRSQLKELPESNCPGANIRRVRFSLYWSKDLWKRRAYSLLWHCEFKWKGKGEKTEATWVNECNCNKLCIVHSWVGIDVCSGTFSWRLSYACNAMDLVNDVKRQWILSLKHVIFSCVSLICEWALLCMAFLTNVKFTHFCIAATLFNNLSRQASPKAYLRSLDDA